MTNPAENALNSFEKARDDFMAATVAAAAAEAAAAEAEAAEAVDKVPSPDSEKNLKDAKEKLITAREKFIRTRDSFCRICHSESKPEGKGRQWACQVCDSEDTIKHIVNRVKGQKQRATVIAEKEHTTFAEGDKKDVDFRARLRGATNMIKKAKDALDKKGLPNLEVTAEPESLPPRMNDALTEWTEGEADRNGDLEPVSYKFSMEYVNIANINFSQDTVSADTVTGWRLQGGAKQQRPKTVNLTRDDCKNKVRTKGPYQLLIEDASEGNITNVFVLGLFGETIEAKPGSIPIATTQRHVDGADVEIDHVGVASKWTDNTLSAVADDIYKEYGVAPIHKDKEHMWTLPHYQYRPQMPLLEIVEFEEEKKYVTINNRRLYTIYQFLCCVLNSNTQSRERDIKLSECYDLRSFATCELLSQWDGYFKKDFGKDLKIYVPCIVHKSSDTTPPWLKNTEITKERDCTGLGQSAVDTAINKTMVIPALGRDPMRTYDSFLFDRFMLQPSFNLLSYYRGTPVLPVGARDIMDWSKVENSNTVCNSDERQQPNTWDFGRGHGSIFISTHGKEGTREEGESPDERMSRALVESGAYCTLLTMLLDSAVPDSAVPDSALSALPRKPILIKNMINDIYNNTCHYMPQGPSGGHGRLVISTNEEYRQLGEQKSDWRSGEEGDPGFATEPPKGGRKLTKKHHRRYKRKTKRKRRHIGKKKTRIKRRKKTRR